MNGDCVHNSMRRRVLTQTVGAGLGMVLVCTLGRAAAAAPAKLAKEAVKYTDVGTVEGKDCDDCSQYLPPASTRPAADLPHRRRPDQPARALHRVLAEAALKAPVD
jgi:hypothetical protein